MRNTLLLIAATLCSTGPGHATAAAAHHQLDEAVARLRAAAPTARVRVTDDRVTQIYNAALSHGPTPRASVEAFLRDHPALLAAPRHQLLDASEHHIMDGAFTLVGLRHHIQGVPVYESWVKLLVRNENDHPLVLVNASVHEPPDAVAAPLLTAGGAAAIVRSADASIVPTTDAQLVYYPRPVGPPRLAWVVYADNGKARYFARWRFVVDAINGQIMDRLPGMYHLDLTGYVNGFQTPPHLPHQPNNPPQHRPVPAARVSNTYGSIDFTDQAGGFLLGAADAQPAEVQVSLDGRWCVIENAAGTGVVGATLEAAAPGPVFVTLNKQAGEFGVAQLNAITGVTRAHDYAKSLNLSLTELDVALPTQVNIDDSCNAFYIDNPPRLGFYRAGNECPNMAYGSIIYHEYGHFVVDVLPGGGPSTVRYHEGMADAYAAFLTGDPCVGLDFYGQGTGCLRNVETSDRAYPCIGLPHDCGQVIAGAFWDMRANLIESEGLESGRRRAGQLLLGQIMTGNHKIDPSVTIDVLVLDDANDNILDGTAHYHEINDAFSAHGLPGPMAIFSDGDFDDDGDVDLRDYGRMRSCFNGPHGDFGNSTSCAPGDFDGDDDIDLRDFGWFSRRFTGNCAVTVTQHPGATQACVGETAYLAVIADGQDLAYQWLLEGQPVTGATDPTLLIDPVIDQDFGSYRVLVTGGCDQEQAFGRLDPAPTASVQMQPTHHFGCVGEPLTMSVEASGAVPLRYQWFHDGAPLAGATTESIIFDAVAPGDVGGYTCAVTDRCGMTVTSMELDLILQPPVIVSQPTQALTCAGGTAEFHIVADGQPPVTYQWLFEAQPIPGATDAQLVIEDVTTEDLGLYRCRVSDGCGASVASDAALLAYTAVTITTQPLGGTFCSGGDIFLFVGAPGATSYQWFRDGAPLPGETNFHLAVLDAEPADGGDYHVLANGPCNEVASEVATLAIQPCAPAAP